MGPGTCQVSQRLQGKVYYNPFLERMRSMDGRQCLYGSVSSLSNLIDCSYIFYSFALYGHYIGPTMTQLSIIDKICKAALWFLMFGQMYHYWSMHLNNS